MNFEQIANVAEFTGLLIVAVTLTILTVSLRQSTNYRSGVGLAFAAPFFLLWINLGVGIIGEPDDPANLIYTGVLIVAAFGSIIAKFQPRGMALAMNVTAIANVAVALITIYGDFNFPPSPLTWILVVNGFIVALWLASAWMFRRAAAE